jgi:hypothetical protein
MASDDVSSSSTSQRAQLVGPRRLWTLRRDGQSLAMELCPRVDGCELRFVGNGRVFASQVRDSGVLATRWAAVLRNDFIADGWSETYE